VFNKLLEEADVLVENFKPGVIKKMGYDWESIHQRWPRLVMCSISGYGQTGPATNRPGKHHIFKRFRQFQVIIFAHFIHFVPQLILAV
jgi:crotonobetainyl-CoA:carnitine CoA-transferase CaiB-like acyl-CoA transferase